VNEDRDYSLKTKRLVIAQITICKGCCCGNTEHERSPRSSPCGHLLANAIKGSEATARKSEPRRFGWRRCRLAYRSHRSFEPLRKSPPQSQPDTC